MLAAAGKGRQRTSDPLFRSAESDFIGPDPGLAVRSDLWPRVGGGVASICVLKYRGRNRSRPPSPVGGRLLISYLWTCPATLDRPWVGRSRRSTRPRVPWP